MKAEQPIVDLSYVCMKTGKVTDEDWENVAEQLRRVFSKFGYCYLINHGVPEETVSLVC